MSVEYLRALEHLKTHTPSKRVSDDILAAHLKLVVSLSGQKQYKLAKLLLPFLSKSSKTVQRNAVDVFAMSLENSNQNKLIPMMIDEFLKDSSGRLVMAESLMQGSCCARPVIEKFLKPTIERLCALDGKQAGLYLFLRQIQISVSRSIGYGEEMGNPDIAQTLVEISQRHFQDKSEEIRGNLMEAWAISAGDEDSSWGLSQDIESVETLHTFIKYGVDPTSLFQKFIVTGSADEERAGNITQWLIEAGAKVQNTDLSQASPWLFDIVRTHPSYVRYMLGQVVQRSDVEHKPNQRPAI